MSEHLTFHIAMTLLLGCKSETKYSTARWNVVVGRNQNYIVCRENAGLEKSAKNATSQTSTSHMKTYFQHIKSKQANIRWLRVYKDEKQRRASVGQNKREHKGDNIKRYGNSRKPPKFC